MTNKVALILALIIATIYGYDWIANDGQITIATGKRLVQFITWFAFWH